MSLCMYACVHEYVLINTELECVHVEVKPEEMGREEERHGG